MPTYPIFGGYLRSEIALAGLRSCSGSSLDAPPNWSFRRDRSGASSAIVAHIGREQVSPDLTISLSRCADGGVLLGYSAHGLGEFHISADGRNIVWRPGADPQPDALRSVLLGKVMATAMFLAGTLCLHGSAIALDEGALCFVAPKSHGKSTLAAALVAAGASLMADDVSPVVPGKPAVIAPGVTGLRLLGDAEAASGLSGFGSVPNTDGVGKAYVDLSATTLSTTRPRPLGAIYVLSPVRNQTTAGRAVHRILMPPVAALELVVRHASIARLLSTAEARPLLTRAAELVRSVPVYTLHLIRDLGRLPEVVAELLAWHAEPVPVAGR
jgi:hypothetical protein